MAPTRVRSHHAADGGKDSTELGNSCACSGNSASSSDVRSGRAGHGDGASRALRALERDPATQASLVLHRGALVHQYVAPGGDGGTPFAVGGIGGCVVAMVAGCLIDRGMLRPDTVAAAVLPGLSPAGYGSVAVQDLLDMRSGVRSSAASLAAATAGVRGRWGATPDGVIALLFALRRRTAPGTRFWASPTDVEMLALLCERAAATPLPRLLSDLIWEPLGMESSAYVRLDRHGQPLWSQGLSIAPRDLLRLGQAHLLQPHRHWQSDAVLSVRYRFDTRYGGEAAPNGPGGARHFRNQMWSLDPRPSAGQTLATGAHGQMLYVDPATESVAVVLSSWPAAWRRVMAERWLGAIPH